MARHESLRTRFSAVDGAPRCSVDLDARLPLEFVDLSQTEAAGREPAALALVTAAAGRPFDLARCPLLRLLLVKLSPQHHLCCIVVDHIVADGISMGILFIELPALYHQHTGGRPAALPPLAVQYLDYVAWQEQVLAAGALDVHVAFWKQELRGLPPVLALPTDWPRPRLQTSRGARRLEIFPAALVADVKALAKREGVTTYMALLAGVPDPVAPPQRGHGLRRRHGGRRPQPAGGRAGRRLLRQQHRAARRSVGRPDGARANGSGAGEGAARLRASGHALRSARRSSGAAPRPRPLAVVPGALRASTTTCRVAAPWAT